MELFPAFSEPPKRFLDETDVCSIYNLVALCISGSIKGYMEAGASAVVLSDTIFDNQLMRDGKFSEISELANLATLEALQFTK